MEERKKGEGICSIMSSGQSEDEVKMSEALATVAGEHNIKSVTAIALAYVLAKLGIQAPRLQKSANGFRLPMSSLSSAEGR